MTTKPVLQKIYEVMLYTEDLKKILNYKSTEVINFMRGNDKQWTMKDRIVSSTVNCQPPKYQWGREKKRYRQVRWCTHVSALGRQMQKAH